MALGASERGALLRTARGAIRRALASPAAPISGAGEGSADDELESVARSGAFVSLHRRQDGELRGCIGCFEERGSLGATVAQMAVQAALHDPRFPALTLDELDGVAIEISVLSARVEVSDPAAVKVGTHGVVVSRGSRRGVLLPQVATEHGWDRVRFLDQTCVKAGLPPGAWREPGTRIQVFSADVFSDSD